MQLVVGHKRITPALAVLAIALTTGCLPDPQRVQAAELLDRLVGARATLSGAPEAWHTACETVGDVQTKLYGEPGLVDVRPAWPALRDAAEALQAVCGQSALLRQPSNDSQALNQARQRWQRGIEREIAAACDHLHVAGAALGRAVRC